MSIFVSSCKNFVIHIFKVRRKKSVSLKKTLTVKAPLQSKKLQSFKSTNSVFLKYQLYITILILTWRFSLHQEWHGRWWWPGSGVRHSSHGVRGPTGQSSQHYARCFSSCLQPPFLFSPRAHWLQTISCIITNSNPPDCETCFKKYRNKEVERLSMFY